MAKWYHKIIKPGSPIHTELLYFYKVYLTGYNKKLWEQIQTSPEPLKVIIGAGNISFKGWIETEYPMFDATNAQHWAKAFGAKRVDNLLAEHVMEHLNYEQNSALVKNAYNYLKPGGIFRVAVPDEYNPDKNYYEYARPGGSGDGADDHKIFWNYTKMSKLFTEHGFKVELIEYYDEQGNFKGVDFEYEPRGVIRRSKIKKYQSEIANYSSLIIDAVKM